MSSRFIPVVAYVRMPYFLRGYRALARMISWQTGNQEVRLFLASPIGGGVGGHCFFLEYLEALVCHETRHGRYLSKSLLYGLSPAYKKHLGCSASVDWAHRGSCLPLDCSIASQCKLQMEVSNKHQSVWLTDHISPILDSGPKAVPLHLVEHHPASKFSCLASPQQQS